MKEKSKQTRICGAHFEGGERICRNQLPTIFPWSSYPSKRREIVKHDFPVKPKKKLVMDTLLDDPQASNEREQMTQEEPKEQQQLEQTVDLLIEMTDHSIGVEDNESSQVNQELADLREEVKLLKKQLLV